MKGGVINGSYPHRSTDSVYQRVCYPQGYVLFFTVTSVSWGQVCIIGVEGGGRKKWVSCWWMWGESEVDRFGAQCMDSTDDKF